MSKEGRKEGKESVGGEEEENKNGNICKGREN